MNRPDRGRVTRGIWRMATRTLAHLRRVGVTVAILLVTSVGVVSADEDWAAFLDQLKTRGYDDVALVYLKQLQSNGQAPPDLDAELDYHIGAAAFEEGFNASGRRREELLNEAAQAFEKYLELSPDGGSALEAQNGLARINADRGDKLLDEAKRKGVPEKYEQARVNLAEAKKRFAAAASLSKKRINELKGDDGARTADIRVAQAVYLDVNIRYANLLAQIARTYPVDSNEYKDGLIDAAKKLETIFTTYQQYVGAFKARFSEAQIYHELEKDDEALVILSELSVLPYEEEHYLLKTRALLLFAEIVDKRNENDRLMELVGKFVEWSEKNKLPDAYYQSAEGKTIYLLAGKAMIRLEKLRRDDYGAYTSAGNKAFVDKEDLGYKLLDVGSKKTTTKLTVYAAKTLSFVASGRTDEAMKAQELLKDEIFKNIDLSKYSFAQKANTFDAAVSIATRAATTFSNKRTEYLATAADNQDSTYEEMQIAANAALDAFRNAIDLSAKALRPDRRGKLPPEKVINVHDEIHKIALKDAVVAFAVGRYEEAFVMADYVARGDDIESAAQGAVVALRALQSILAAAKESNSHEVDALEARVADYVAFSAERWGDDDSSPIAQEANLAQLESAAAAGNVNEAFETLVKIPEDSPRRVIAELTLGRTLWVEWTRRSAATSGTALNEEGTDSSLVETDSLLENARKTLYDGLERKIQSDEGAQSDDASLIYASYLLSQVYAQQGNYDEAHKWLIHPIIGALTAIDKAERGEYETLPVIIDESFKIAVLSLELRIAANTPDRLDDAMNMMARLDELVADAPDASAKLTRIYLSVGKRFEERLVSLKKLADNGDQTKRQELLDATAAFDKFLNNVSEREDGNNYASLRWIAESFLTIGKELLDKNGKMTPEATPYLAKSRDVCKKIIANIAANPSFAPAKDSELAVKIKVCEILRYEGKYSVAYKNLCALIATDAKDNLDAQWETASLLEAWGDLDSSYYAKSIAGDAPNGERIVWGWNGMIKRLAPSIGKEERLKTMYFDACKARVRTRYKYVRSVKDPEEKKNQAQAAEDDVKRLWQMHPGFNGPETTKYFDDAYRAFQKIRGVQNIVGLKETGKK